jgi:hypothetical protein
MTRLTPSQTRDALRRAVGLLRAAPVGELSNPWRADRVAFLDGLKTALGVSVSGIEAALAPQKRGRDKKKRKSWKPKEKSVDQSSGSVPGSILSRTDRQNPPASPNADGSDVEQIAVAHTVAALRFQQMSL